MIVIQTRTNNIFSPELHKWIVKRLLGKQGGPFSVLQSLIRGLKSLDVDFKVNSSYGEADTLIVLSGKQALQDAIKAKKAGKIKKLIAGPNVHFSPLDDDRAICNSAIDIILVPSDWVKNLWSTLTPNISEKIIVWPAGVAISKKSTRLGVPIIYNKLDKQNNANQIADYLSKRSYKPITFNYGNFSQEDYFKSLETSPFMIYLSKSESQGLAIQEAWARDVPTFILKSDKFSAQGLEWKDDKINAPYLNDDLGFFFEEVSDIESLIAKSHKIEPQLYCERYLSDKACAEKLLEII